MAATRGRRSVVITGASTGIGDACARHLAAAGYRVFAGVRRDEDAQRLRSVDPQMIELVLLDVTDAASIAAGAEAVGRALDDRGLDGLVNNAGIAVAAPLEFVPIEELRRQLEVNTVGPVSVTQAFLPLLRKARGRIVHIGSLSGLLSVPFLGPYCASKFALEALADAMRMELAPWSIHVSIVDPGSIDTPIWKKGRTASEELLKRAPPEFQERYGPVLPAVRAAAETSARRGISPAVVAKAVEHALTSRKPKSRYLVGIDARIQGFMGRTVPARWRDRLVRRAMGLPR
jgi:NAD(P)-dependent dehydrogenase (short-subunit alcohol dehydrogenase family)